MSDELLLLLKTCLAAIDKNNIYSLLFLFYSLLFLLNAHSLKFNGQKLLILKKTLAFSL